MQRLLWSAAAAVAVACSLWVVGCSSGADLPPGGRDAGADTSLGDGNSGADVKLQLDGSTKQCPSTCQELNANCGPTTDTKCSGVIQCGSCTGGQTCGGGGPNRCGTGDAGPCVKKTCAQLGVNCGPVSDGCGGLLHCGSCPSGQTCGATQANVCGPAKTDGGGCTPQTCAGQGIQCGPAGNGCGQQLNCGSCPTGQTCGGGGVPGQCGNTCTALTCAGQNVTCGAAGDGCGGTLDCGSCTYPKTCGGNPNRPGQCGCTGLCSDIPDCPSGQTTTLSGTVYDPAGIDPLYNVLVYVPNNPSDPGLQSFPVGPTCDVCGATAAGNPLITTHTAANGTFTLSGIPVPSSGTVPVVIQLGRWRRVFTVNIPNKCGPNTVSGTGITGGKLTMPKDQSEGNIPLTAVVTGNADALECVFYKMGISPSEFTDPSGGGRIHLYRGDAFIPDGTSGCSPGMTGYYNGSKGLGCYGQGAVVDPSTPSETALFQNNAIDKYDMVILSCQGWDFGSTYDPSVLDYPQLSNYANSGGRIFASHFSYDYLTAGGNANPFYGSANWDLRADFNARIAGTWADPQPGVIDTNAADNPKGQAFATWLGLVGALSNNPPPTMSIQQPRWSVDSVIKPTQPWINRPNTYTSGTNGTTPAFTPEHFTFNTPIGGTSTNQCGRVLFSDFHVAIYTGGNVGKTFPAECSGGFTAQEKALEFMIFDLGSCVQPYQPVCTPRSCADQGIQCGPAGDGCGNLIQCGSCATGQSCGGGGQSGQCGSACTPQTCADQGISCGPAGDGCGHLLQCGSCLTGQSCGGGGVPGQCGGPDGGTSDGGNGTCTPETCAGQGIQCGPAGDGCGKQLDCGSCPTGQTCGGGGVPGQCGAPTCIPLTCADQHFNCGPAGDGCGGTLDCGTCATGQFCGLNKPGQCGSVN